MTFEELLRESDYITIHTPRTKETINMVGDDQIALMKPGVRLVNAARGGLFNEEALYRGLRIGAHRLGGHRHLGATSLRTAILSMSSTPWSARRTWAHPLSRPPSAWARRWWPKSSPACVAT